MKSKQSFRDRLICFIFEIPGSLDEYKRSQIDRVGNNCFLALMGFLIVSGIFFIGFTGTLLDHNWGMLYLFLNFLFILILLGWYVTPTFKKLGITTQELSEDELKGFKWRAGKITLFQSMILSVTMWIVYGLSASAVDVTSFIHSLFSENGLLWLGLFFIIYWLASWSRMLSRTKMAK